MSRYSTYIPSILSEVIHTSGNTYSVLVLSLLLKNYENVIVFLHFVMVHFRQRGIFYTESDQSCTS